VIFDLYSEGAGRISEEGMMGIMGALYRMYYQNAYAREVQQKVSLYPSFPVMAPAHGHLFA